MSATPAPFTVTTATRKKTIQALVRKHGWEEVDRVWTEAEFRREDAWQRRERQLRNLDLDPESLSQVPGWRRRRGYRPHPTPRHAAVCLAALREKIEGREGRACPPACRKASQLPGPGRGAGA